MKNRFARVRQLQQKLGGLREEGRKLSLEIDTLDATPADKRAEDHDAKHKKATDRIAELRTEITKLEPELTAEVEKLERDGIFEERRLIVPGDSDFSIPDEAARARGLKPALETWGWKHLGEFAKAVAACRPGHGTPDARLTAAADRVREEAKREAAMYGAPTNYHESSAAEGHMVPPAFRQEIMELVFDGTDLVNQVDTEPTDSNIVHYIADESTPWGSTGVQAYWRGEAQQMSASRLSTKLRTLSLNELYAFVLATSELLEDATRLAARLTRRAAMAIRWKASESIYRGNGVGQPLGIFNAPAKVTQAKESGQTATTITTANIAKMFSRLYTGGGGMPVWLANRDIVPQLVQLTIGDQPVWTGANGGMRDAPSGLLMGYPVQFTEHADTLGQEGDLTLADLKGYYSPQKRSGLQFAQSMHLYFDYNIEAFRWTFRMAGMPYLSAAITPHKGSATKSHFVTLAVRS